MLVAQCIHCQTAHDIEYVPYQAGCEFNNALTLPEPRDNIGNL